MLLPPPDPSESHESSPPSLFATVARELISAAVSVIGVYLSAKIIKRMMDPNAEAHARNRERKEAIVNRLLQTGVPRAVLQSLSSTEEVLLNDLVFPEDITSSFESIGGLQNTKETLRELIIYPLLYPDIYESTVSTNSSLLSPPKGILLYGPPGTGKTLLAKALAKESGANFLALSPSSLLSKWLGDTEQLAKSVFSLAKRVQPTIIFIDEIDGLFRERSSSEHEAHKNLKAEFMQLWDGLTTDDRFNRVVVLGATNRPYDVDPAILRRMPRPFEVALPDVNERQDILKKVLSDIELHLPFDFRIIALETEGYSGSDLKELCRAAMMQPLRESVRSAAKQRASRIISGGNNTSNTSGNRRLRALTLDDVLEARREVATTQQQSSEYRSRVNSTDLDGTQSNTNTLQPNGLDLDFVLRMMQALQGGSRGGAV